MKKNKIVAELHRIADSNDGALLPELVVYSARKTTSPLHSCFTWDNTKAAHQYRLWQARQLIRVSVQIVPGTENITERIWVSLSPDRENDGGYRSLISVMSDKQLREQLLEDAMADMKLFADKYRRLSELAVVFTAMKKVRKK